MRFEKLNITDEERAERRRQSRKKYKNSEKGRETQRINRTQSDKKYREKNVEYFKKYMKEYRDKNKDTLNDKNRKYKKTNGKRIREKHKKSLLEYGKMYGKKRRAELDNGYMQERLQKIGFSKEAIKQHPELIEVERLIIKTKRLCKTSQS